MTAKELTIRAAAPALGALLLVGVVVTAPSSGIAFKSRAGFSPAVLAQRPRVEYPRLGMDGVFHLDRERQLERNIEYSGMNALRYRLLREARIGSPYQRVKARRQIEKMLAFRARQRSDVAGAPRPQSAATGRWRSIGPDNLGGRTHAILIDPTNPEIMYAGGIAGGVWKSENAGGSWRPLNDTFSNIAISSLAFDPNDSRTIYAGTGDAVDQYGRTGALGAGIIVSTDAGANWQFLTSTQNPDFLFVNTLVFSPNDEDILYAGTTTGIWMTRNGGSSWTQLFGHQSYYGCTDMDVSPEGAPDRIIASCGGLFEPGGVFLSTDGGSNWENVIGGISGAAAGRSDVSFAPSDPSVVYASIADPNGIALGLVRSDSGGASGSWEIVNDATGKPGSPPFFGWCDDPAYSATAGQGYYDNVVAVDPTNPERVWVGGVDLFRSDDGGRTLHPVSYWWLEYVVGFNADLDGSPYIHADQHALVFHPDYDGQSNTTVFFGNDGGLFRTDNATAAAESAKCDRADNQVGYIDLNDGYVTSLFREGAIAAERFGVIGGLQDNGSWRDFDVSDTPNEWEVIAGGDGGYVAVHPSGSPTVVTYPQGFMEKITDQGRVNAGVGIDEEGAFVPPLVMDPNDPNVLWTGMGSMWRSTNLADSWEKVSGPLGAKAATIAVADGAPELVLAATESGALWRTVEGGKQLPVWTEVIPAGGLQGPITSIGFDPNDPNVAYLTVGRFNVGKVYKSTDGGTTWNNIDGVGAQGIPDTPAHSVAVNPLNSKKVYVGTDSGVFESLDGGQTWSVARENLATTTVEDLIFRPNSSELYVYTFGRGVYRGEVGS
jgi:photosystem II stability/assembly factor-like uncharacterized protein